jgi:hypothetical protein
MNEDRLNEEESTKVCSAALRKEEKQKIRVDSTQPTQLAGIDESTHLVTSTICPPAGR